MLHDAISFYENLITNLEKYFDFNFRFYATEGILIMTSFLLRNAPYIFYKEGCIVVSILTHAEFGLNGRFFITLLFLRHFHYVIPILRCPSCPTQKSQSVSLSMSIILPSHG